MSNAASVVLVLNLISLYDVSNVADTVLLFDFMSLRDLINAASDAALLFNCQLNNRNMSIFVVP